jgi:hypothetical protein
MAAERGGALLEVMVALLILATVGSALVILVADGIHAVEVARAREAETDGAAQLMARLALRDARGLDIRLGRRVEGSLVTDVQRPRPGLYRLAVSDSAASELELLVTVVYRAGAP